MGLFLLATLMVGWAFFGLVDRDPNHHAIVRHMEKLQAKHDFDLYIHGWGETRSIANPRASHYGCVVVEAEVGGRMRILDRIRVFPFGAGGMTWYFVLRKGEVLRVVDTSDCFYSYEAEFESDADPEEEPETVPLDVAPIIDAIQEDAPLRGCTGRGLAHKHLIC